MAFRDWFRRKSALGYDFDGTPIVAAQFMPAGASLGVSAGDHARSALRQVGATHFVAYDCSCGWVGDSLPSAGAAAKDYVKHVDG